jgi:hypothetical protein
MPRKSWRGVYRVEKNVYVNIPAGTGAAEFITDWSPGYAFTVESVKGYMAVAGAGAGATRVFRVLRGAATVVATVTLAVADATPLGKAVIFTVTPANATFSDADVLTVDTIAAGAVEYTAGKFNLTIVYRQAPQAV